MRWFDTMVIPAGAENVANAAVWMNYVYDPENAARIDGLHRLQLAGRRACGRCSRPATSEKALAESPLLFPDEATLDAAPRLRQPRRGRRGRVRRAVRRDHRRLRPAAVARRGGPRPSARPGSCPTGSSRPGSSGCSSSSSSRWSTLARTSLSVKDEPLRPERHRVHLGVVQLHGRHQRLLRAVHPLVRLRRRSPRCSASLIGYPMAYVIAFRGGRYRNLLLGLVVVPFFTSFLIRTLAWQTSSSDQGPVISAARPPAARRRPRLARDHERRPAALHPRRGDRRAHLQLPAVHDPADLREPREDRPAASPTRPRTSTTTAGRPSARSCCRCRSPGCSPAACSPSSPRPATSSTPSSSAARRTR